MTLKQTKFLEDTAAHFNLTNRAIASDPDNGVITCVYSHAINGGCAIGRHLSPELAEQLDRQFGPPDQDSTVRNPDIFDILPDQLKQLGMEFLDRVQRLHDDPSYWTFNGLSLLGEKRVEEIKQLFA